jgi:5-dehydro-2-deoxygluconokinase
VPDLDVITVGRVNLDLYAQQVGVEFPNVTGWDAMVGGCPANVVVAAARLSLRAGLFSAVGDDLVGEWVLRALERERVSTEFVLRKRGPHSSLALRAQVAPDHPLAFYRHDPADIHLTFEDSAALPLDRVRALLVSADALSRGSTARVSQRILDQAPAAEQTVYVDLDLRDVNWPDLERYAAAVAPAVERADVTLGTASEFAALLCLEPDADEEAVLQVVGRRLAHGSGRVLVVKRGARGATVLVGDESLNVAPYRVVEASTVGAGDSFAAGLIYARLGGRDWPQAAQLASACAAITVSRYGCSRGFPSSGELASFVESAVLEGGGC